MRRTIPRRITFLRTSIGSIRSTTSRAGNWPRLVLAGLQALSKAKGGKPVERNIRDLCWIIPGWIERIQKSGGRVDVRHHENVEEFKDYGPLIETERGLMPDPERKASFSGSGARSCRRRGAAIEYPARLIAYQFGAPTIRKRLFVIIRFDGKPIVWPEPTHGKPDGPDSSPAEAAVADRAECIDWSLLALDLRYVGRIWAKHQLPRCGPLADATMARVRAA